jgi:hypothetical protein
VTRTWADRRLRVLLVCAAAFVVLAVSSELLLPVLAERRLRHSLERYGAGVHVDVSAHPAVKLLLGRASRVSVRIRELRAGSGSGKVGDLISRSRHADRVDAEVGHILSHGLRLDDVTFRKRGDRLDAGATVTTQAISAALPLNLRLATQTVSAQAFLLTAATTVFGQELRGTARVAAAGGQLELTPATPLAAFLRIRLFADPRVAVDGVRASATSGRYRFTAAGHLR